MQKLLYVGKIVLVSICFRMLLTQVKTPYLEISSKYQYLTGITILIPMGRFFDTIIDVDYCYHALTYVLVQHWY